MTSIGDDAFSECSGLTSITIPKGVNRIGDYAFWDCCGLTSIVVDAGNTAYTSANGSNTIIEKASNKLIVGCSITVIPEGVTNIAGGAFYNCSGLTSITIPKGVTSICHHAFEGCSGLTSITIPESVTNIGEQAFYRCSGLTSITIHKGLTNIDNWGFADCSGLTSVTIPNSVTNIGDGAFASCHRLKSVIFLNPTPGNFPETIGLDDDCIVYVPKGSKAAYEAVFPQYIIVEEGEIFTPIFTAKTVEGVDMTFKVISEREKTCMVGDEKGEHVHSFPTDYNGGITIPSTANGYKVTRIGSWAFSWCRGLTSVNIPETVTSIGTQAFNFTGITEIVFPNSLESIEGFAFQACGGLTSMFVPKSVTFIDPTAFGGGNISSITVENGNPVYDSRDNCNGVIKTAINELIISCCNTIIPKTVTRFGVLAISGCFTSFVIPAGVTSIGDGAFYGNDNLTEILSLIKEPTAVTFDDGCWNGINPDEITLYVLKGTKEQYEATEGWSVFKNIIEKDDAFFVDNAVYINDTLARQGRKMTLSLKMKNTAAIRGFQFDLYLPEGVTVAKNSKGKILGALSEGRLPDEDEHSLTFSEQADGAIRFLCSSQYDETFTRNDGEIATLQVNIAEGMADGDYLVQLKNMKLTESDIDKYLLLSAKL